MSVTNPAVQPQKIARDSISPFLCKSMLYELSSRLPFPFEPRCEKTGLQGFRPGPTQTGLYSHRRWPEAWNFGFR